MLRKKTTIESNASIITQPQRQKSENQARQGDGKERRARHPQWAEPRLPTTAPGTTSTHPKTRRKAAASDAERIRARHSPINGATQSFHSYRGRPHRND
jgi:hypothetical protein